MFSRSMLTAFPTPNPILEASARNESCGTLVCPDPPPNEVAPAAVLTAKTVAALTATAATRLTLRDSCKAGSPRLKDRDR
jgi:hypothetical protein